MSENTNTDYLFVDARRKSSRECGYDFKTQKNNNKRNFIEEYIKYELGQDSNIQECAQDFLLIKRGINPQNYFCERDIASPEEIKEIYDIIKKSVDSNFIAFYESYLRKIGYGYNQDFIDSSIKDVKVSYITLRKCKIPNWDCPEEMITVKEMENLYAILTQKQPGSTKPNKALEEK